MKILNFTAGQFSVIAILEIQHSRL